jgi:hypothetical protein
VRHLGVLAHSSEGAALCFLTFCQEGFRELGAHQHPDVTMDCIAMGRSMPAWEAGEHQSIRATLAESVERLARSGAEFFVCPDNGPAASANLAWRPLLTRRHRRGRTGTRRAATRKAGKRQGSYHGQRPVTTS